MSDSNLSLGARALSLPAESAFAGSGMDAAPLGEGRAPAKVILVGEHAVVYGQTAIALPLGSLEARARVYESAEPGTRLVAHFPASEGRAPIELDVSSAPDDSLLATAVRAGLRHAGRTDRSPWRIEVTSDIPTGRGLGSSAAVAVAIIRAIGSAMVEMARAEDEGWEEEAEAWDDETVSDLALEAERRAHGSPSGIDNTVVTFARPIRFREGQGRPLELGQGLRFLVADSGTRGNTAELVAAVRRRAEARPRVYGDWLARIGQLGEESARAIAGGEVSRLGRLMNLNHLVLQAMRVSTPELDSLVSTARKAGAWGAKLTGSGGGGAIIVLVDEDLEAAVRSALSEAGAVEIVEVLLPGRD